MVTSSPKFSQSNSFIVEAQGKNFKYHSEKGNDPNKILHVLRATPLENGESPDELLCGRKICKHIPTASNELKLYLVESLRKKKEVRIKRQKQNFDEQHLTKDQASISVETHVYKKIENKKGLCLDSLVCLTIT